ncbi:MAG: hypothetical protein J1G02_05125 [Clostridiales bacterium]|nr:hypothetical protein [Clostridiales bacterium]
MSCKVIVNRDSGNCSRLDINKLLKLLDAQDAEVVNVDSTTDWSAEDADTVVICGGDGTLHNAIEKYPNKQLVYAPCGTLNETSATGDALTSVGKVNGMLFSYVCATGSFTEIGYSAKTQSKKRLKSVAYLPLVLKFYKSHQIHAKLDIDERSFEDDYTLLMILKSHRCFGFNFNKAYKQHNGLYLLAIKSAGIDNLANRAKMFFPFFKVFFTGANPGINKNWMLLPFTHLTITLEQPQAFCVDGELRHMEGVLQVNEQPLTKPIPIVKANKRPCKYK